ncbi:hypothetical protein V8D89_009465 [Ganoderma adspersum]
MPKAAASKDSTTHKHAQSPKKGHEKQADTTGTSSTSASSMSTSAASTSAAGTSTSNDPSQWHASRLRDSDTITRTEAKAQYRLNKDDNLEGIPFQTTFTLVRGEERTMYIYKEKDIERRAWEKHGGPEGSEEYSDANFPLPRTYQDWRAQMSISSFKPGSGPFNFYGVGKSPTLLHIKERMVPWVWIAYNRALWEGLMMDALVMMPTYPPRPAELLAPSPSMDKVRAVLADAPQKESQCNEGLTITVSQYDEYGNPDSFEFRWSEEYLEHLFTALIEVIEEHGTGPEGFEGIRWEVYNKYVDSLMGGPHYDQGRKIWTGDTAAEWLDGQFTSVKDTYRAECPAGQRFNDLLPRLHPQGERSVGVCPQ